MEIDKLRLCQGSSWRGLGLPKICGYNFASPFFSRPDMTANIWNFCLSNLIAISLSWHQTHLNFVILDCFLLCRNQRYILYIYGLCDLEFFFIILTSKTYGPDAGLNWMTEWVELGLWMTECELHLESSMGQGSCINHCECRCGPFNLWLQVIWSIGKQVLQNIPADWTLKDSCEI